MNWCAKSRQQRIASMSKLPHSFGPTAWLRDCNALLLSAVCHLALLAALGGLVVARQSGWGGISLVADVADQPVALDDQSALLNEMVTIEVASPAAEGGTRLIDDSAVATADIAPFDAAADLAASESGRRGISLIGIGESQGLSTQGAAEFFGVGGYGKSFVYVVDCSGSMREDGKFERAKYELLHSIEQLSEDQRYFIVFFSDDAYPMPSHELIQANEDNFARTRMWVNQFEPNGGTYPLAALQAAVSLRPDAIFFLSDGRFDTAAITRLRALNSRRNGRIAIHAIAFMNRENVGLMRAIAGDSGGEFRFVR
jgi:hypothetical protein